MNLSRVATSIQVGSDTYDLTPLQPGDFYAAQRHVTTMRIKSHMEDTQSVRLPDKERANSLAEIQMREPSWSDVLNNFQGRLKILHLSMLRAAKETKKPVPSIDVLAETLGDIEYNVLFDTLLWISRFPDENPKEGADPLGLTTTIKSGPGA